MIMLFIITFISLSLSFVNSTQIIIVFINIAIFRSLIFMTVSFAINLHLNEHVKVTFQDCLIYQVNVDIKWLIQQLLPNYRLILKFNHLLT